MRNAGVSEHTVRYGGAAVAALRALIDKRKGSDPLAPVTVVVPTRVMGLALRRALAAGACQQELAIRGTTLSTRRAGGLVGVRVVVVAQLAELLAGRVLARGGRTPLTDALRREHVRLALAAAPGALRGVAGHPATERLADRAVVELRRATAAGDEDAVLAELDAGPALPRTLAGLYRAFRARAGRVHYDEQDLALTAADVLGGDPAAAREVGATVVFLPQPLAPAEAGLVQALGARVAVDVLDGAVGEDDPVADAALSAPDDDEEVRSVVREIARLLRDGQPLERVAVLYGDPQPYATLVAEHLSAADLPVNGPVARALGQTIPGRVLAELLALPEQDYARQAVVDWLALAPLRTAAGSVPAERWAAVAEAAGVGRGREQWGLRLRAFIERAARRGDEARTARSLLAYVDELFAQLDGPAERTWAGYAAWADGLLDRCLGPAALRAGWPDEDRKAEAVLRERLAALAVLDGAAGRLASKLDLGAFRRTLHGELDEPAGRIGRFGVGVYLGPLATATALDFDHVFVVGMAEGAFPARPAEQPLLPDPMRHRLRVLLGSSPAAAALPTRDERTARERAALLAVLSSGARTTLCYPRADRRRQRERMPSPWFLELAGRRARAVPSTTAGIASAEEPAIGAEWVARELLGWGQDVLDAPLVVADPGLTHAITVTRLRDSAAFTAWDGRVGGHPLLDQQLSKPHAPTALSRYGVCPRQYLLSQVLGVRERENREDPFALDGARRGVLLHRILERFLGALASDPAGGPEGRRGLLHGLADEALAEVADRGIGDALRWRLSSDLVHSWLDRWLGEHERLAEELGVTPVGAEVVFGPIPVRLPRGRTLAFAGRMDRIDAAPGGGLVLVTDYKTSSDEGYKGIEDDPVLGGTELQLAVYALAAEALYPDADVQARYWFLGPRTTKAGHRGFAFDRQRRDRTVGVLDVLAEGIGAGAFPPRPGPWNEFRQAHDHCRSCAFDRICPAPAERERAWERDAGDPQVAPYRDLVTGAIL